jgi:hypothetical protein
MPGETRENHPEQQAPEQEKPEDKKAVMTLVCAYCGKVINQNHIAGTKDCMSHGLCRECSEKSIEELDKMSKKIQSKKRGAET